MTDFKARENEINKKRSRAKEESDATKKNMTNLILDFKN
jgi:hypothetical protein